ncbi:MAG: SLC13 family permease [Acidobacteria bacterium]|nr:SLC13 family permease [Acidobacteriota bacterium]MDA1236831.1 SLC13 family permease [Acidobacteriota bacterium]
MHPLVVLLITVALIFLLIIKLRINPFIALVTAATTVGVLSPLVKFGDVMPLVAGHFGRLCGNIGIVIALAALIGQCLMESGAADKIVRVLVRLFGEKNASLSMLTSGYILSVPVFFDTVFYLLIPLARALRVRTGKGYVLFIMCVAAGGTVTHSMVPPTPGPLGMAANLNVDLGVMILVGAIVAVPMSLAGWAFALYRNNHLDIPLRETPGMSLAELEELAASQEDKLPSFFVSMLPIVLPVLMITSNTLVGALEIAGPIAELTAFLGNPNFALLVSAAISVGILMKQKGLTLGDLTDTVETALASGGLIILITAGGGAFGGMLVEAEVGSTIGDMASTMGMPVLILSFLLAAVLKVAQGSGTVAMITGSAIMAPIVLAGVPFHPVYVACIIGAGSLFGSWMNDSGFWVYAKMSGLTEIEALQTWTPLLAILGATGAIVTLIMAALMPLV